MIVMREKLCFNHLQNMEIKYLKEEVLAMKKTTLQIQYTCMPKLETKMTILEAEKESLIKTNVEMKSRLIRLLIWQKKIQMRKNEICPH